MFPGMGGNPRQMAEIMRQLGMKSEELKASRVVIEMEDGARVIVSEPQVVQIEMKGTKSFQVSGEVSEESGSASSSSGGASQADSDLEIIVSQTGASKEQAQQALQKAGGDIAQAIMLLEKDRE